MNTWTGLLRLTISATLLFTATAFAGQEPPQNCPYQAPPTGVFDCESIHPFRPYRATVLFGETVEGKDSGAVDVVNRGRTWHSSWEVSQEEGECGTLIYITVNTNQSITLDYYTPLADGRYFADVTFKHKDDFVMAKCRRR